MLGDVGLQRAAPADRLLRLRRRVEADDDDVLAPGGLQHRQGAEGRVVVDPEDALEVAVRLQHVLHDRHRLRPLAVGRRPAHDADPGRLLQLLVESLDAVLDRGHGRVIDDEDLALALEVARQRLRREAPALDVVAGHVGDDLAAAGRDVHGEDGHARRVGVLDGRADRPRVARAQDDGVHPVGAPRQRVLHDLQGLDREPVARPLIQHDPDVAPGDRRLQDFHLSLVVEERGFRDRNGLPGIGLWHLHERFDKKAWTPDSTALLDLCFAFT